MARTKGFSRLSWAFAAALAMALCLFVGASSAPAEDNGAPNFFQMLFGAQPAKPPETAPATPATPAPLHKVRKRDYVPSTTTRAPGAPGGAPAQATFHVQVIGDTLAIAAYEGLVEAFADKPEIGFTDQARDASGLIRSDYFDWAKYAADTAKAKDKPDFVVIMLGANDGQPIRDGADVLEALSDRWSELYAPRIDAVLAPFIAAHIPVAWIGLPPMRADKYDALAVKLNAIFRERVERAGGKFIDIYDAFTDENGDYDAFGPDVEGQKVKLRLSDGIHFTKAGERKIAHFLEAEIRRVFDKRNPVSDVAALPPDIEQAADDINAQIRREMGEPAAPTAPTAPSAPAATAPVGPPPRPLAGPIIPLTGLPISPGGALASRETHPLSEPAEVTKVLRVGEPDDPAPGRADDFSWPKI